MTDQGLDYDIDSDDDELNEEDDDEKEGEVVDEEKGEVDDVGHSECGSFDFGISCEKADQLYNVAGTEEPEEKHECVVLPSKHILSTNEEMKIFDAARELGIPFVLDEFQVQSLVSMLNGRNVVLTNSSYSRCQSIY